jgi:hypothetical protein
MTLCYGHWRRLRQITNLDSFYHLHPTLLFSQLPSSSRPDHPMEAAVAKVTDDFPLPKPLGVDNL